MKSTACLMAAVMYLSPIAFLFGEVAQAAPITDPRAPIQFQPTIMQSPAGSAVVNITAPNAQGLSVNQFQRLSSAPAGLVFNNSLTSGTSLTGGQIGANPNLAGRTASTILAQVTSTGSQYASVLAGPIEIFGNPASLIISNPNGISVSGGVSLTNASNLVLTTGVPQFLSGVGGASTSFPNAGALAYNVSSGNITINGPAGVNGPGAGIEGTVGNIDVIAQTINLNAPLRADQKVNLIAGNQLVTPAVADTAGTSYGTASNGTANTAAAIGNGTGNAGVAIDASQFGSVTSGTIFIVSTAQGMGVNALGPLAATAGNAVVNSNGDITVGDTFASQNVNLASTGSTTITGTGLANQNYTVSAGGDINATGPVSAGQNVAMNAGNNLSAAALAASGSATVTAGGSMSLGSLSAQSIALQATSGDLTLGSAVTAPGTISAIAGRNLSVNGSVQGGSTVALTGGANTTVNGSVSGVGDIALTAQTGSAQVAGNVVTNGALTVLAGQSATLGGGADDTHGTGVSAQGPISVTATAGDATLSGTTTTPGALTVTAGGNATLGGQTLADSANVSAGSSVTVNGALSTIHDATLAATGGNLTGTGSIGTTQGNVSLTAGQSISYGGSVQGGAAVAATAGLDATLANVSAPGAIAIHAGRDASETGNVNGGGTTSITGGRNAGVSGSVASVGDVTLTASSGTAAVGGNVLTDGALAMTAAQGVMLGGTAQAQGPVSISAQSGSIAGQGSIASSQGVVSLNAGQDIALSGGLQSGSSLSATAGGSATLGGAVTAPGAIMISAGQDATIAGGATGGSTLTVTAGGNAAVQGAAASIGDMNLSAASGTLSTSGNVATLGTLSASGQQGVNLGGTVYSQGNAQIGSGAGSVTVAGALSTPGAVTITAGQDAAVSGTVHTGQSTAITAARDATLNGGVEVDGTGNATLSAGRDLSGNGALSVANDATLTAGRDLAVTGAIQTGNNLAATAGGNLSVGKTTAVGNAALTATGGSATLSSDVLTGGDLQVTAAADVAALGSVTALGNLRLNAQGGNLSADSAVSTAGSATLNAGQAMALNAQTTVSKDATLTGSNITTQGLAVGGNLSASATNNLDTSAGQLDAAFSPSAPALSVGGNATLTGANVSTANAVIGGAYNATGTTSLTTGGTAAYQSAATLAGGTVTNVGTQMAAGNLTVSGSAVTNQGALSSLQTMSVNATNLANTGTIYGLTSSLNVANSATNSGGLYATNALSLSAGAFSNAGGLVFAGDVDNPAPAAGDVTVSVSGGNGSFDNTNGRILAQNNLTLNLPNQAFDPSAASSGTLNLRGALTIDALQLSNSGVWAMPGNSVSINTTQGFSNSGTISKTGDITLSTTGTLTNSGTISAGNDVNLSGTIVNQAGGTIQANEDVSLTGVTTNAGTVSAVRDIELNGTSYDNSGATTAAGRNLNANLAGDLTNVGGTISAQNDITVAAANVDNRQAASSATSTSTSTTTIAAAGLASVLLSAPMGSLTIDDDILRGDGTTDDHTATITGRVGDLQPSSATIASAPDLSGGTFNGIALPTVIQTATTTQTSGTAGVIAAGHDLSITTGALNNHGSTISAGNNATLNVASLDNGGNAAVTTVTDSIDPGSYASFLAQLKAAYAAGTLVALPGQHDGYQNDPNGTLLSISASVDPSSAAPVLQTSTLTTYTAQSAGQIVAGNNLSLTGTGASLTNTGNLYAVQDLVITANNFTNQGYHASNLTTVAGCAPGVSQAQCGYFGTTLGPQVMQFQRPGQAFTDAMTNSAVAASLLGSFQAPFGPNNDAANIYGDQTSTQSYSYTQTDNTVFAGRDLVIAAPVVNNTDGNLLAGRDVVIGGAGTSRDNTNPTNPQTNLTQSSALANTSGNIQAGRDIAISTAALTSTLSAPVQVYQNYGTTAQFGCSGASVHYCDAFIDEQSGDASTITANRNLSISAGTLTNTGSLITAGSQASVTAASTITNQDQTLNAYWHDAFYGGVIDSSVPPGNFGCGTSANCSTLFGSAYHSGDGIQPPTPYASLPGTIQAPSLSVTAGGQLQNSGNVMGQQVAVTGATIVNGITSPGAYTPQTTGSQQVIPLGPVGVPVGASGALAAAQQVTGQHGQSAAVSGAAVIGGGTAIGSQSVGAPGSPTVAQAGVPGGATVQIAAGQASSPSGSSVQTLVGQTSTATYLVNNPASLVMGDLGPQQLLAALPASLQPGTTQFYYDPFSEDQILQQAALRQTGQASFVSGLSFDNKNQTSVANQEKQALYSNAIQYAEANNIALGTALSPSQIAALDAPMLWYVEQTVPQPGCTATGSAGCPTVNALMPQVYLPQNYASVEHDGTISGQNVTLTATNGGTITNTGSIAATDSLTVNAGTLTNQQRSTDIGTQYTFDSSIDGLLTTTGTVVQQGGFMSAGNYQMNVDALDQIGGALQKLNADGSVDTAGSQQELAALKAQLGSSFTQGTVSDNLHTDFTSLAESEGAFQQIGMLAVMVVASVITAGAASAVIGGGATAGSTFAAGTAAMTTAEGVALPAVSAGLGNIVLSAGIAGMTGSALGQAANGSFSFASTLEAGGIAMLTAGLTNGITVDGRTGSLGFNLGSASSLPDGVSTLGQIAGVTPGVGSTVPQSAASVAGNVARQGLAIAGEATLQAGVQTVIGGGSFLTNLKNDAVSDVAAAVAFGIGDSTDPLTLENMAEHAVLGCAASAAGGTGCAGGALGAATSAVLTPFVIAGLDPNGAPLDPEQAAATTALALLAGGGAAALLGQNATAGATWAENEAQNNDELHAAKAAAAASAFLQSARNLVPGVRMADQAQTAANAGNYKTAFALALGSVADAAVGIATLGDSAIAEQAAGKVVSALDGTAGIATNSVKIVEQQGNVYEFSIPGANGDLSVITEMTQNGNQLVLNGMHIQGSGSGTSSLSELRSVARALGQQYGVDEVVINGGERTSGANIGKNPRPITIKVNQ